MAGQVTYECTVCGEKYTGTTGMDDLLDHLDRHTHTSNAAFRMTNEGDD